MNKAMWIDWFVLHLSGLRPDAGRASHFDLAHEVYPHLGHLDPIEAAQAEFDAPPPQRLCGMGWPESFSDAAATLVVDESFHDATEVYQSASKVARGMHAPARD